jgi:hypothetical protein
MTTSPLTSVTRRTSVAMSGDIDRQLYEHLVRADGQEDLCFALYQSSTGATRDTALLVDVLLPSSDERHVHGNASFTSRYFLRAAGVAADRGLGLVLLHTHPGATTWQRLSADDAAAEASLAVQTRILTGKNLVGLTYASGDRSYSARFWDTTADRPRPAWAESVRIVGDKLRFAHNPELRPPLARNLRTLRTVHAWGAAAQDDLARVRIGLVGAGSVGALLGEALARMGFKTVEIFDFDGVETHNLDRLLHARQADADNARSKAELLAHAMTTSSVTDNPCYTPHEESVVEREGWAAALDCDVLFSCVDRPWPRFALNAAAYAHLIPVIDGGIAVDVPDGQLVGAEWRAHAVGPGRRCMECLGQYDPADVGTERLGLLDDARYIAGLPDSHPLKRRENVIAFSMACASAQLLEFLRAALAPSGVSDVGAALHHWTTGAVERDIADCEPGCLFSGRYLAAGDSLELRLTGRHAAAEHARATRREQLGRPPVHASEGQRTRDRRRRVWHRVSAWLRASWRSTVRIRGQKERDINCLHQAKQVADRNGSAMFAERTTS